jgi:poly-gamma-glutamate synthesis protein (capsule biosynthesis protein)
MYERQKRADRKGLKKADRKATKEERGQLESVKGHFWRSRSERFRSGEEKMRTKVQKHRTVLVLMTALILTITVPLGNAGMFKALAAGQNGKHHIVMNGQGSQPDQSKEVNKRSSFYGEGEGAGEKAGKYDGILADEEYCRQNRIYPKETADPGEISLVFAGDILFDDSYAIMASMKQRKAGIDGTISADLLEEMRGADIFMVNNEFPYTNRGTPLPGKTFTFRARPENASMLLDMGADIVSLANNHAYDYGEVSLTDSIDTLNGIGMPFVGAGRNLQEAAAPVYFIANDTKIAFISATQIERMANPQTKGATDHSAGVFRCREIEGLLQAVREARAVSDYVIVYIHWGTESTDVLDSWQLTQAPQIAASGADLIIGAHPHVLQPVAFEGEVPVIYSLGNFLFNSKMRDSCLVKVVLGGEGIKSIQFIPAKQASCKVSMASGTEKERILAYMRRISPTVTIDENGFIEKGGR